MKKKIFIVSLLSILLFVLIFAGTTGNNDKALKQYFKYVGVKKCAAT